MIKMLKVCGTFLILSTFVLTVHSFDILDIGSKVEVIKHEVNGTRLLTVLSTDSPDANTLTVHVS